MHNVRTRLKNFLSDKSVLPAEQPSLYLVLFLTLITWQPSITWFRTRPHHCSLFPIPEKALDSPNSHPSSSAEPKEQNEQYMSSIDWLAKRGLNARKMDLYDALASCSFRHCDGVVDVKMAPDTDFTDAVSFYFWLFDTDEG